MKKRILSIILTLALCLSMLPATALAAYITPQSATQCGSYYIYYYAATTATQCVSYDADSGVITVTNPPNSNTIFISSDSNVSNSTSTGCTTITGVDASFKIEASPSQITLLSGRLEFNSGMVVSGTDSEGTAWAYTIPDSVGVTGTVDADGVLYGNSKVSMEPSTGSTTTVKWEDDGNIYTMELTASDTEQPITVNRSPNIFTLTNVEQVEYGGITYEPLADKDFQLLIKNGEVDGFVGTATVPAGTTLGIGLANLADIVTVQCAAEREISCYYSEDNFSGYPTLEGVGAGDTITLTDKNTGYLTLAAGILTENEICLIAEDAENTFTINSLYAADDSATPSITLTAGGFQDIPVGTLTFNGNAFTVDGTVSAHIVGEALCWHSGEVTAPEGSKIEIGLCAESAGGSHYSQVYTVTAGTFQLKGDTLEANKALSYLPTNSSLTPAGGETITAKAVVGNEGIHFDWDAEAFLLDAGEALQIGSTTYAADTTTDTVEVLYNGAVWMDNGEKVTITAAEDNPKVIFTDSTGSFSSSLTIPTGTAVIERVEDTTNSDYFALVQGHMQIVYVDGNNHTDGPITVNGWEIKPYIAGGKIVDVDLQTEGGDATVSGAFIATKDGVTLTFTDPSEVTIDAAGNVTLVDGHVEADSGDILLSEGSASAVTLGANSELAYDKDAAETKVTLYSGTISNLSQAAIVDGSGILFEPQDGATYDINTNVMLLTIDSGSVDVTLPKPGNSIYCANSMSCTNPEFSNISSAQYVSGVLEAKMNFSADGTFTPLNPTTGVTYENSTVTLGASTEVVLDSTTLSASGYSTITLPSGIDYTNTTATDGSSITLNINGEGMAEVTAISGNAPTLKVTGQANVFANGNLWAVADGSEILLATDSNSIVGILTSGTVELAAGEEIGIAADTSDGSLTYKTAVGPATVSVEDGITYVTAHGEAARAVKWENPDTGKDKYTIPEAGAVFAVDTTLPYPILISGTAKAPFNDYSLRFGTTTASRYVESQYGIPIVVTMDKDTLTATITANDNGDAVVKKGATTSNEYAALTIASGSTVKYTIHESADGDTSNDTATLVGAGCAANSSIPVTAGDITVTPNALGTQSFNLYVGTAGDISLEVTQPVTVGMEANAVLKLPAAATGTDYNAESTLNLSENEAITAVADATLTIDASYVITCDSLTTGLGDGNTVTVGSTKPAEPTGLEGVAPTYAGGSDGKITGVSTAMEWKAASDSSYTACTGTVITGLSAGTYYVRVAETVTTLASEDAEVTVPDGTGSPVTSYTITVNGGGSVGTVTSDKSSAAQGETVTVTVVVNSTSHEFGGLTVTGVTTNTTVDTTKVNDTTYTFTMPAEDVEISASWTKLLGSLTVTAEALSTPAEGELTLTVDPFTGVSNVKYYYRVSVATQPNAPVAGSTFNSTGWTPLTAATADLTGVSDGSFIEVIKVMTVDGTTYTVDAWGVTQSPTDDGYEDEEFTISSLTVTAAPLSNPAEGQLTLTVTPVSTEVAGTVYYYRTVSSKPDAAPTSFTKDDWTTYTLTTAETGDAVTSNTTITSVADGLYIEVVCVNNGGEGSVTAWGVTASATNDGYEAVVLPNLVRIVQPDAITGIANGTALASIELPNKVTITTSEGEMEAAVIWNTDNVNYDPDTETQQTFTVPGTVTLPDGVTNTGNVSLTVSVSVTVDSNVLPDLVSIIQPDAITGIANGTALADIALPVTVTITTSEGEMEAAVIWNTDNVNYDPDTETEQTFAVPGAVTLPDGVTNTENVSLTVSVSVTVAAKGTVTLTGISLKAAPEKTTYTEGETLNLTGLVVILTYSDGSTEDVALADFADKGVTVRPANGTPLVASETTVSVHAGNYSASFAITVTDAPVLHIVSFDANGGTGHMESLQVPAGDFRLPESTFTPPARKQFIGWSTEADGEVIASGIYTISRDTDFYAIWEASSDQPARYTVTIRGGGTGANGAGSYAEGESVTITAGRRSNYSFDGWTASGVTLANPGRATTTFTMPANDVAVTAHWSYDEPNYSDDDDDDYTSSRPSSPSTPTVTVPISGNEETIHVDVTIKGGVVTIDKVDLSKLDSVIGNHVDTGTVTIDFSGLDSKEPITTVELPSNMVKEIAAAVNDPSNDANSFEIILSDGTSIEFDAIALGEKAAQADGLDITISIEHHEDVKLTNAQKNAVGNRPAYDINVTSGGKHISDMGGKITVHAPYELRAGEKARGIVVWYVDDHGKRERCETSYDPVKKRVNWKTDHLSLYMIDYDPALAELCDGGEDCPGAAFVDVNTSLWYHQAIDYAIENGLMGGYGNSYFGTNDNLSRGMLAQILYNLEGKPAVSGSNPFTDVADTIWYANAVKWAAQRGITAGTGDGTTFSADAPITREQLAVMLWNYAGTPDAAKKELEFTDAEQASDWAVDALIWAQENNIMAGDNNAVNPNGNATRAHVAQMLKNFLENVLK